MDDNAQFNGLNEDERRELQELLQTRLESLTGDDLRRYYRLINRTVKASYKKIKRQVLDW